MPGMGTPELPVPDGLVLRPFRGVRFDVEDPAKVTSPPYDLISDADVEALLASHPNNVVRLILPCNPEATPATEPGTPRDPAGTPSRLRHRTEVPLEARYSEARDTLRAWLDAGVLVADDTPALYVYEQSGPHVLQRGLIGDVGLVDPADRVILPHEDVMPGPIADRLALMSTTEANLEPIFLLYNGDNGRATRLVDEVAAKRPPLVTAGTEDGLTHRLWAITDPDEIDAINADLRNRQALIADGHHRYATYRVLQRQEHAARQALRDGTHQATPNDGSQEAIQPSQHVPLNAPPSMPTHNSQGASHPSTAPDHPVTPSPSPITSFRHELTDHLAHPSAEPASAPADPRQALGPWDFGLALIVDSTAYPPDLKAIHRVIPGLPLAEAAARARGAWQVHDYDDLAQGLEALQNAAEPAFLLAGESGTHLLTDPDPVQLSLAMPDGHSDRWNSLNTSILSEFILPKVWGMEDDERAVRIVHHDTEAALRLAIQTGGTAVILKPLMVDDVLAVAAGGERVPRKSTSFGPKPRTGLVLRTFAID
ncbi:DUF1015 domain-containing protein [Nonomuraea sp. NPDC001023]|uniref:DUF1015 domain-containing protein n=2 Tax=unclassified Nonomuraea TaxID=2593643 RepID=UPI0033273F4E